MGEQRRRRLRVANVIVGFTLAVGGTTAHATAAETAPRPAIQTANLTVDGADSYAWFPTGNGLVIRANDTNQGTELRTVWWAADANLSQDQQSCVTWSESTGVTVQPGIALRIRTSGISGSSEVRAVTISNNVWVGNRAAWNIHTWVAREGQPSERELIGQVPFVAAIGDNPLRLRPLPWRICGRAIGSTVALKVWAARPGKVAPAWGDSRYGAAFALPDGWDAAGVPGGYTGHLDPGSEVTYNEETTAVISLPGLERLGVRASAATRTASYQTLKMALSQ